MSELDAVSPESANTDGSEMQSHKWVLELFRGLGKVLNDVGIAGFVVICISIFIFFFTDKFQKSEIVDTWILFKNDNNFCYIIVIMLIIMLFAQQIHYKRVIAMKQERINELANKKSSNYSKYIGQKLSSSNKPKKS